MEERINGLSWWNWLRSRGRCGEFQGIAAYQSAQYQASVAEMNEKVAKENARRAIERSQVEQQEQDAQSMALLAAQEAVQSASGLTLTGKSAQRTRRSARILARKDALNVRQAGEIEKYNYLVQAENFKAEGEAAKMQGSASLLSSFLGAGTSSLGGSSSIFSPDEYKRKALTPVLT